MKEAVSRKKGAHKAMCQSNTEENKRYKSMKNKAKKAASKAMREKAEEALSQLKNCQNRMIGLVKEVGGRCMRGSDGRMYFSEKEKSRRIIWKRS